MPKVSVIIQAYNAMNYLPKILESVLKQTFTDFEVLIINDGSTDNIIEWASQITDPRVKLISQENQGQSAARNLGIVLARGDYLAFLDADNLWLPTKLEKQVNFLDKNPEVGLVNTWVALTDEHGKPTGTVIKTHAEGNVWKQIIECPTVICGSSPLVRSDCFEKVGLFDKKLSVSADWEMWIRIASRYSFAMIKEPLVFYRQYYNSQSKNCQKLLEDNSAVIEKTFKTVPRELQYIKRRSYGQVYLYLAWRALDNKRYQEAIDFRQQAVANYPQLFFSWNYIRQGIALMVMPWLGVQAIDEVRNFSRGLRRRILTLKS
ncbi:MAG: glycosyl transferase family A [Mastigocladus sp. ERB_26_2]